MFDVQVPCREGHLRLIGLVVAILECKQELEALRGQARRVNNALFDLADQKLGKRRSGSILRDVATSTWLEIEIPSGIERVDEQVVLIGLWHKVIVIKQWAEIVSLDRKECAERFYLAWETRWRVLR